MINCKKFFLMNSERNRIIRLLTFIFISFFLSVEICYAKASYSSSTLFTLDLKNKSVKDVLTEIEKTSEFIFFYYDDAVDVDRKVDIQVTNQPIDKVLAQVFKSTDNTYVINDRQVLISKAGPAGNKKEEAVSVSSTQQQTRTITGVVTDNAGEPLIGVTIMVNGTTNGTSTNETGQFTLLNVAPEATLAVSYIGYITQQMRVGNTNNFNIRLLEDTQNLGEVVVVGYGTQKKETLTGAVSSINSAEIATTKTDNMLTNMSGKLPGLLIRQATGEPGDFNNLVSIRGYGRPIVVIDGIVRNRDNGLSDLAQLNSDDIETISILKDASAAIYGMNSANGVIIVTTKKGEATKTRITYSGMYSLKMPTGMPDMMTAYEYRLFENEFQRNVNNPPKYDETTLEHFKNGDPGYTDWDWINLCLRKVVNSQNHSVSIRGGTNKVRYFNNVSYNDDNGLYKSGMEYYHRWTLRSNLTADLTNDLTMNVGVSGRLDSYRRSPGPFIYDFKTFIVNDRGTGPYALDNPSHLTDIAPEDKNPMALCDPNIASDLYENTNASAIMDFTYKVPSVKGLNLNVLGSLDFQIRNRSNRRNAWDMYNYLSDSFIATIGADSFEKQINLYKKTYGKFQANYVNKFGGHSLTLLGAVEASEERFDWLMASRQFPDIFTFPTIHAGASTTAQNDGTLEFRRYAAFFGRANYDFQGKYLLEVMARYDGSYRYAPNKRWVLFPSISVGWRVSEENFFKKNITFINNLKLRASYGESGNDQGNPYEYVAAYTSDNRRGTIFNDGSLTAGMYPPGVVNDYLSWVTAKSSNIAMDIDFLKSKISATLEYFERRNTGILATRIATAPNFFGASFPQENLNSDLNRGLELQLKYRNKIGKDFGYSVGANITFARTERLHQERAPFTSAWDKWVNGNENRYQGRNRIYIYDGQYTSLSQYETAPLLGGGLGNTKMLPGSYRIIDVNGDGRINGDDQLFRNWAYGNQGYVSGESLNADQRVNPPLQFGFPIDARYKSFDFNMLFQGAALYSVNYNMNDIWGYGRYPTLHTKFRDRWHTTNPTDNPFDPATVWIAGKYPAGRPYNYDNTTDALAVNVWRPMANYLRLKNVELGYTIPRKELKKAGFENLRIFVNGTNLLLFCKKELKQTDPERHENDWEAGLSYPIMKQVNFGINLNF